MSEWIEAKEGSHVTFHFNDASRLSGKVLSAPDTDPMRPTGTGKYWVIQTYNEGKLDLICYVDGFNKMFVYPEPPKD